MICSFDPLSNFSLSFVYTLQEQELVIADRGVHCTDLPVLPRAERLSFKVSADFRMAERQRDRLLQRDLMPTNKHVRLKNKFPDEVLTFLQKSDGKFKKEDFDPGHLRLLQNMNEEQTSAALAYLLDMMNKHNPRERGLPMNKWIGGVLRKWIKNTT